MSNKYLKADVNNDRSLNRILFNYKKSFIITICN